MPYTRLKLKGKPVTTCCDESPLTDVTSSDADESDDEKLDVEELTVPSCKILKPKGEAGKSNSGGHNLKDAMGWEDKEYATFSVSQVTHVLKVTKLRSQQNYVNNEAETNLDIKICYSKQKQEDLDKVIQSVWIWAIFQMFLLPYNLDSKPIQDNRQVLR